jgi:hypothetical protein
VDTNEQPKRKAVWPTVATLVALFLGYVAVTSAGRRWSEGVLSPGPCTTIGCIARTKPAPAFLREARIDDRDYVVWFAEWKPLMGATSGPPCYVFDDRGRLVTWSIQTGEGGDIMRYAGPALSGKPVALETVLDRLGRD